MGDGARLEWGDTFAGFFFILHSVGLFCINTDEGNLSLGLKVMKDVVCLADKKVTLKVKM